MIKFVDLFSGIGGFHEALKDFDTKCVVAVENNKKCQEVYKMNFPNTLLLDDINEYWDKLPDFDLLVAGFPCQPFSRAGKKNGFDDINGKYFYLLVDILKIHPECEYFVLENVPQLYFNKTYWNLVEEELKKLDFHIQTHILCPSYFGIPQLRKRLYIIGTRKKVNTFKFEKKELKWSRYPKNYCTKENIYKLVEENKKEKIIEILKKIKCGEKLPASVEWQLSKNNLINWICTFRGYGIRFKDNMYFPTMTKGRPVPIIPWINDNKWNFRYLWPKEIASLHGFNDNFKFLEKDSISYNQLGNSVSVDVLKEIFKKLLGEDNGSS